MIKLVTGLGNVGAQYEGTRHNIGFEVVDRVASALKAESFPATSYYDWSRADFGNQSLLLAWPRTFMNRSGEAVDSLLLDNDIKPDEALIVVDDFNLELGRLRFRPGGSDGGHNGLASLIECLQTDQFPRLRLGIGPLPDNMEASDFVLGRFEPDQIEPKKEVAKRAAEAILFALRHPLEEVMSQYNE